MEAKTMKKFAEAAKKHLADYKLSQLGIAENGTWSKNPKKEYAHILPKEKRYHNLLASIRTPFVRQFPDCGTWLHDGFAHLNSSQAMAFNLVFPFAYFECIPIFCQALDIPANTPKREAAIGCGNSGMECFLHLESILDQKEETNFDLVVRYQDRSLVLCEVKYGEANFGSAKDDPSHHQKIAGVYRPLLKGKIHERLLGNDAAILKHYQLLRYVSYLDHPELDRAGKSLVLFIFPKENESLKDAVDKFSTEYLLPEYQKRVRVVYLEDIVQKAQTAALSAGDPTKELAAALAEFRAKYLFYRA
jgi:hypothetical protein